MVILSLLTSLVFAEQLVVIENESSLPQAKSIYSENSTILVWSSLQRYPLKFSNATQAGECSVYPKSIEDVTSALANVQTALDYWELDKADGHLLRVEGNLRCLNEIASSQLLSEVYFVSGLTYFQRKDEKNAIAFYRDSNLKIRDITPFGPPSVDLAPVTYIEYLREKNEEQKTINVIKPSIIEDVFRQYQQELLA